MRQKWHEQVLIEQIEATAGTQTRYKLDKQTIDEYTEVIKRNKAFPSLVVFTEKKGSERYILADGFHRLAAAKAAGLLEFACEVHLGGMHDALGYALSANEAHGLRRTQKDKRNAVELALKDPEWSTWNSTDIAALCSVSDKTVTKVREELIAAGKIEQPEKVKITQGGKVVERKPTREKEGPEIRTDKKADKTGTSKKPRKPKTQNEIDRGDFLEAMAIIRAFPFAGDSGYHRLSLEKDLKDVEFCRDWLTEVLVEGQKQKRK